MRWHIQDMALNKRSLAALEASIRRLKPGQSLRRINDFALKITFNTTDIIEAVEAAHNLAGRLACDFDYDAEQGIGIFRRKALKPYPAFGCIIYEKSGHFPSHILSIGSTWHAAALANASYTSPSG